MSSDSILDLFEAGTRAMQQEHADLEATKVGVLRAGNAGIKLEDGIFVGKCPRRTYLRFIGLDTSDEEDEDASASKELMFDAGRGNEDLWYAVLSKSGWEGTILREEEIPISWMTSNGVSVTGRPDLVLCKNVSKLIIPESSNITDAEVDVGPWAIVKTTGPMPTQINEVVPVKGIELKLVCSMWTALSVGFNLTPKLPHLIQAAHYSWKLGIPFELWYTNRVNFAINCENPERGRKPDWKINKFPKHGEPLSERLKYTFWVTSTKHKWGFQKVKYEEFLTRPHHERCAVPKDILPFKQGFEIETREGVVHYRVVGGTTWTPTILTTKGIEDYYEAISQVDERQELPPRPKPLKADGKRESWSECDYCPFKKICDENENNFGAWKEAIREAVNLNGSGNQ